MSILASAKSLQRGLWDACLLDPITGFGISVFLILRFIGEVALVGIRKREAR